MTTDATSSATSYAGLITATEATATDVVEAAKQGIAQSRQSLISSFLGGSSTQGTSDFSKLIYENSFLSSVVANNATVTTNGIGKKISTFATPTDAVKSGLAAKTASTISILQSANQGGSATLSNQILEAEYVKAGVVPDYTSSNDEMSQIVSGALYAKDGVVLADQPEAGSQFEYQA